MFDTALFRETYIIKAQREYKYIKYIFLFKRKYQINYLVSKIFFLCTLDQFYFIKLL